jgi:hypothetical protein
LQEEDKDTLLQFFRESLFPAPTDDAIAAIASILRIEHLLHLPLVALSSGQTRRSRIAAGLLAAPRMLILEDPFAGLDVQSRKEIASMLGQVNSGAVNLKTPSQDARNREEDAMRLVLSLRGTGTIGLPEYVTHVARVMGGEVETLGKEEYVERVKDEEGTHHVVPDARQAVIHTAESSAKPVVDVQGVSIAYGEVKVGRAVLQQKIRFRELKCRILCLSRYSTTSHGVSILVNGGTSKAPTDAGKQPSSPSSSATIRNHSPSRPRHCPSFRNHDGR